MTIVALANSISPSTVERATADSDPYERETQLNALARNFDDHDHALGKNLGVKRLQTTVAPAAAGEVRVNGDTLQWWGATAGAIQSALTTTQTITGATLGDPIVRDAILFGEQGTALAPDVTLARTGVGALQLDSHLWAGLPPGAWAAGYGTLGAGVVTVYAPTTTSSGGVRANSRYDGTDNRALVAGAAVDVNLSGGEFVVYTAPAAAAGAVQAFVERARVSPAGTLTVTPVGAAPGLAITGIGDLRANSSSLEIRSGGHLYLVPTTNYVIPTSDGVVNLGAPAGRYAVVYATTGTINTSSVEAKENIRDFLVDEVLDALRVLRVRRFDYRAPAGDDDPAAAVLRKNIVGFVSEEAPALFTLGDDRSVSPQQTAVIGLAGLKALLARVDAHEVRLDALEAGD